MARWVLNLITITIAVIPFSQPISAIEGGPENCRRAMIDWYGGQSAAEKLIGHTITDSQNKALQSAIIVSGSTRKLLILLRAGFTPTDGRLLVVEGYAGCVLRDRMHWQWMGRTIPSVIEPLKTSK